MDTFAHGEGIGVIVELHLVLASLALVDSANTRVLLVEPRALDISLLLGIVVLGVDFANEVGDLMDTLVLRGARISTSEDSLSSLEVGSGLSGLFGTSLTEVIPVLSAEVAGIVASFVTWDDSAKALGGSLNWSIDKRELSNVVLVDHSKDGLLLADVDLWISNILLIGGLEFPL